MYAMPALVDSFEEFTVAITYSRVEPTDLQSRHRRFQATTSSSSRKQQINNSPPTQFRDSAQSKSDPPNPIRPESVIQSTPRPAQRRQAIY
jgi:hypothetical protein